MCTNRRECVKHGPRQLARMAQGPSFTNLKETINDSFILKLYLPNIMFIVSFSELFLILRFPWKRIGKSGGFFLLIFLIHILAYCVKIVSVTKI